MHTLGVIGGVGPESTIDYYRSLIAVYRERKGDGSYPQFLINSIDLKKEIELVMANDIEAAVAMLVEEIDKLAKGGADFGLMASNTPHLFFDDLQSKCSLPLISIVEVTADEAQRLGLKRLGVFGSRFTMSGNFYPEVFGRRGLAIVSPKPDEQEWIHDKYMNELVNAIFRPETKAGLLQIAERLQRDERIDALILGGTELPLILREPSHNGIPFLNTTQIHVQAAVARMLS